MATIYGPKHCRARIMPSWVRSQESVPRLNHVWSRFAACIGTLSPAELQTDLHGSTRRLGVR